MTEQEKMNRALKIAADILSEKYDESDLYDGLGDLDGDDVAEMVQSIGYALEAATALPSARARGWALELVVRA